MYAFKKATKEPEAASEEAALDLLAALLEKQKADLPLKKYWDVFTLVFTIMIKGEELFGVFETYPGSGMQHDLGEELNVNKYPEVAPPSSIMKPLSQPTTRARAWGCLTPVNVDKRCERPFHKMGVAYSFTRAGLTERSGLEPEHEDQSSNDPEMHKSPIDWDGEVLEFEDFTSAAAVEEVSHTEENVAGHEADRITNVLESCKPLALDIFELLLQSRL
ncbi:uncharacterized protein Z519_00256 [Cladophialophora bantiana CBS 173.52]|uniref:Uncharacterized protein n=1 Tax=Cladophialophora bantiana (strain ATCC 10958 / CBS 173.52 / CDC B-1940 / NIH 8579) TaxID=1442370 RepID=A0A0D2I5S3_CLAB1|nr:uncharacterized protein Z519_00256 [Cladophialophora bantiana CBS 173.52]KIW98595.1 hypothetical protein Z519_00256 [Cladophialophora bantiana CBS 173.52]